MLVEYVAQYSTTMFILKKINTEVICTYYWQEMIARFKNARRSRPRNKTRPSSCPSFKIFASRSYISQMRFFAYQLLKWHKSRSIVYMSRSRVARHLGEMQFEGYVGRYITHLTKETPALCPYTVGVQPVPNLEEGEDTLN